MRRRILTVFLASPGDLQVEREIVRSCVERVNKILARRVGWQIELLGWEDTLPGYSRPQALINKDVDSCDLFLGVLWRRWGQHTGKYSSGFEEEFTRARDRRAIEGKPEIWLFFKNVDEESRKDPGDQLKRVLKFKDEQVQLKELFFKEFDDSEKWGELINDDLIAYVLELAMVETPLESQEQSKILSTHQRVIDITEPVKNKEKVVYPSEIISLFDRVNQNLKSLTQVKFNIWDGTRLYLQTSAWFSKTHLGEVFGNHEINLVYLKRKDWEISESEREFLIRTFISDYYDHRPGWYWLNDRNERDIDLVLERLSNDDLNSDVRQGATKLLADTGYKVNRNTLEKGLSDNKEQVILNTIQLVRNTKNPDHLDLLDPLIKHDNSRIRESALSTKIEILYLNQPDKAFLYLIESGAVIPSLIKNTMYKLDLRVETKLLFEAIEKAATSVRRFSAEYLRKSKKLSNDICYKLLKDPDAAVRKEGLLGLIELGEEFDMGMVRKLFPEPKESRETLLGYGLGVPEVRADDFIPILLKKRDPQELLSQIDFYDVNADEAYQVLVSEHFHILKKRIRSDLDSEFESLRLESEVKLKKKYGEAAESIIKKLSPEIIDFIKSKYISAALDGLAKYGKQEDVKYARKYLGSIRHNVADYGAIKILAKFGDASDVQSLVQAASKTYGDIRQDALETAFNLSEDKDSLLEQLVHSDNIAIANLAIHILSGYDSPKKLELAKSLLNSKAESQRLGGLAILLSQSDIETLENILDNYLKQETYYYNVVTWFDRCLYAIGRYQEFYRKKLAHMLETV